MSAVLYAAMQRPSNYKLRLYVLKIDASIPPLPFMYIFSSAFRHLYQDSRSEFPAVLVPIKVLLALYTLVVSKA